ncbi:hypothetical protein [Saccharopolyspora spinosa]|nr:hypothetical protein [Saccharopolyspora spinosa]
MHAEQVGDADRRQVGDSVDQRGVAGLAVVHAALHEVFAECSVFVA